MDLQIFVFNRNRTVRTVDVNGEIWFVAADVCDALTVAHAASSLRNLDSDEKGVHTVHTPGGSQEMTTINESGLYSLILRSRKPEAKAFKRWVTHDVLPAIRRTGQYGGSPKEQRETAAAYRQLDTMCRVVDALCSVILSSRAS